MTYTDHFNCSFVFSVPVTWKSNPAMLAETERVIRDAGFGSRDNDTAGVYLTEAEAAAIYASKQNMTKGEVFLICDAGGGTTDVNVLKVESTFKSSFELKPLSWTEGAAIGSTLIDHKVRKIIMNRLSTIQDQISETVDGITAKMMRDRFETFKCSFGSPGMDVPKLLLPIPGVAAGLDLPHANIEDSKMVITRYVCIALIVKRWLTYGRTELQAIFDEQFDKMCDLIDSQLRIVRESHAGETVVRIPQRYFVQWQY